MTCLVCVCVCVCVCLVPGPEGGPSVWCQVRCNWCRGVTSVWCQVPRGSPCLVPGSVPCLVWGVTSVWCQVRRVVPLSGTRSGVGVTSVWCQVQGGGVLAIWCQVQCNVWCGGSYLSLVLGPEGRSPCLVPGLVPGLVPCLVWVLPLSGATSRGGGGLPLSGARFGAMSGVGGYLCLVPVPEGGSPCLVRGLPLFGARSGGRVPLSGARSDVTCSNIPPLYLDMGPFLAVQNYPTPEPKRQRLLSLPHSP